MRSDLEQEAIHNFYMNYERELRKFFDENGQPRFRISTLKPLYDYLKGELTNELKSHLGLEVAKEIITKEINMLDVFIKEYNGDMFVS